MSKKNRHHRHNNKNNNVNSTTSTNSTTNDASTVTSSLENSRISLNTDDRIQNTRNDNNDIRTYHSATLNEINKYPIVKDTFNKFYNSSSLLNKFFTQAFIISKKIWKSNHFLQSNEKLQDIFQRFLFLLIKLDNLFAVLIFEKGIDHFITVLQNEKNGTFGIWILLFFIDFLADCSNYLLRELIIKPLNLSHSTASASTSSASNNAVSNENSLPHLTELTSTTLTLSKDIQNKVQNDILEPAKDNVKKHFDFYIKPTVDQARETYKTVSNKYEMKLKENNSSISKAIYSTGLDIGNETIERLHSFTHKNKIEISTTKN